ncbi:bifunctional folylpolyglutamate synthase/dihydrofolate synthase [Bernardetia sp.]|uniref:bifunctional folylpolyglutamate synthase/dihydrofolate synthase n=1 Tax=Bernardetia sp. TaxID=1937974 RepID=UPI0025C5D98D|nr:folylpolyglutamate synthase/dihydrofolate synthase family protein [Bernardetia sp.]
MTYQETLDYLYSQLPMFQRTGAAAYRNDLNNIKLLCKELENPENQFDSIHVAGTNGKGSTSHMIASVLQSAGYKVGLYTSPHLKNFTERIRINGEEIKKTFVVEFVEKIRNTISSVSPSFFEVTVAMAFEYFAKEKVDIAVIEVGMGGRLDATNVISPLLSVITNIGFDHQQFLGDTLGKIAAEKAGIIKHNTPIIISQKQEETTTVFERIAEENNAELIFAIDEYTVIKNDRGNFDIRTNDLKWIKGKPFFYSIENITLDLKGFYQKDNIVGVIAALEKLKTIKSSRTDVFFSFTSKDLREGLQNASKNTGLKGRWYLLNEKPKVICDIAHNQDGIHQIIHQLKSELENKKYTTLHIVFGAANDKDISTILWLLKTELQEQITQNVVFYFCKPDVPRGLEAIKLKEQAKSFELVGETYSSVSKALEVAKKEAKETDFIYVGGSAFVVAEVVS